MERREDLVPGKCGLNGRLGGQAIADLPKDNNIRVLSHDMAQGVIEGDVDFGVDGALQDTVDDVFYRLFGRDDTGMHIVQGIDATVQSGGFARACRTSNKDDTG